MKSSLTNAMIFSLVLRRPAAPGCDPPAAPAKKPDGCDPDEAAPAVEPPAYPPSGDCPCDPQEGKDGIK